LQSSWNEYTWSVRQCWMVSTKVWNPCSTVMSYRHSFYLAFIYSFWYQINVVPMQWLSPLLRFFYVIFDIKL
jgi:hypothetical protein